MQIWKENSLSLEGKKRQSNIFFLKSFYPRTTFFSQCCWKVQGLLIMTTLNSSFYYIFKIKSNEDICVLRTCFLCSILTIHTIHSLNHEEFSSAGIFWLSFKVPEIKSYNIYLLLTVCDNSVITYLENWRISHFDEKFVN